MKDISRKWVREWPVASITTQLSIGRFLAYLGGEKKRIFNRQLDLE